MRTDARILGGILLAATTAAGLAASASFQALSRHVDWNGEIAAFVDLGALFWDSLVSRCEAQRAAKRWGFEGSMVAWLHPEQFPAAGLSWSRAEDGGSGRLAILTQGPRRGLGDFLNFPNEEPRQLDRLPDGCQVVQWMPATGKGLVGRMEKLFGELDPDIAREFREELAEFCRELGVDIGKDFLENLGSSVVGASFGGEAAPAAWYLQSVADEARFQACAEAMARFNETPIVKVREGDLDLYKLDIGVEAYYALRDGRLVASTDRSSIPRLLARGEGFHSLADSEAFAKLRRRFPETCLLFWAIDLRSTAEFLLPLALGFAAYGGGGPAPGDLAEALQPILRAPSGLSLGLALRNEPDALVLRVETVGVDLWKMAPGVLRLIAGAGEASGR